MAGLYKKHFAKQARKICLLGALNKDLAGFFEVSERTIERWISEKKDFRTAVKAGKTFADANVANSFYRKAVGYSHIDTDIKIYKGKVIKTKVVKHYPPDTIAGIFWLKNRRKEDWKDKHEVGLSTTVPIVIRGSKGDHLLTLGTEERRPEKGQQ